MLLGLLQAILAVPIAIVSNQSPLQSTVSELANDSRIWKHPSSENQYIEVKECNLCSGQELWSGTFHSIPEQLSIFFIYARASENPETAPLALWTNGGPGTSALGVAFSSATGCILQDDSRGMKLLYKPNDRSKRWNEKVNVIFLDQPIGTGFSRGNGLGSEDTRIGAEYIYDFIQVVLARHPHIPEVSLHSLSYGGHFVPEWAKKIVDENAKVKSGRTKKHVIPLKSVSMGNAWFGSEEQYLSRFDSLCDHHPYMAGSGGSLLSPSECKRASAHRAICKDLLQDCGGNGSHKCAAAHLWCITSVGFFIGQTGRSMYDLSAFSANPDAYDTYPVLTRYLNLRAVQEALGVIGPDEPSPLEWLYYNQSVSVLHTLAGDHVRPTDVFLPALIAAGVDILIYQGMLDFICGFQGVRRVIESQGLVKGQIGELLKNWKDDMGRYLCSTKVKDTRGRFCYLEIDGVGHGVAYDYESWGEIFEKWIVEGSV
jgi:cathepsin A (carboxypeptidase C)